MKILIYMRPNSEDFLTRLAREIDPECEITKICDFKNHGDIWCGQYLYQNKSKDDISEDVLADIRLRCRFLRKQKVDFAYMLIKRYYYGIKKIFSDIKPDVVLAQLPDNYCMDIIQRVALEMDVTLINMVGEFIKGYSRMTLRGEYIYTRESSISEAKKVVDYLLDKEYTGNYAKDVGNSSKQHAKRFIRRKLIENLYYPLKKRLEGDKYNYHYNTLFYKGMSLSQVVSKKIDSLFVDIKDLSFDKSCVYVPLHVYPEATVDYYCKNIQLALYEDYMVDLLKKSDADVTLIVKEHPAMYGARNSKFYYELKTIKNVVLVNPYIDSNYILSNVDYVLTFSGSVGVEALIRKKVVFTLIDNYYSNLSPNAHGIERIKKEMLNYRYTEYDPEIFMKDLLEGLMDAQLGGQSTLSSSEVEKMGAIMRKYYDSHPVQTLY